MYTHHMFIIPSAVDWYLEWSHMLSTEYYSTSINMAVQVSGLLILFLLDPYMEVGKAASYGISTFRVFEKSSYSSNAARIYIATTIISEFLLIHILGSIC